MKKAIFILLGIALLCGPLSAQSKDSAHTWKAGVVMTPHEIARIGLSHCFGSEPIPDQVFRRMKGNTFQPNTIITRAMLRYIRLLHYDIDGKVRTGEMVCNKAIAADLVDIFRKLYDARYPIHRVVLLDNYDANDERAMNDNNSSCFCYRKVAGSRKLSAHARGMAVDINTFYHPYVKKGRDNRLIVRPAGARRYANRSASFIYKIDRNDLCYRLFLQHGFQWGGAWRSCKDYQHFEK